jgi:alpha-D-ribose 1-methylphosphonate 5-triphosphate diphosphatase
LSTRIYAHATAVLPDRVLEDALVAVEDGLITEVAARTGPVPYGAVDLDGALLLPGLVDTHSDGLEKEVRPRPGAEFDPDFAVASFEGRVRAAGVTTIFHGIGYQSDGRKERTVAAAQRLEHAITGRAATGTALVDHRLLLRLDARDPAALTALKAAVAGYADRTAVPLVSFEDHTPGQGQYADPAYYRRWLEGTEGLSSADAQAKLETYTADREGRAWHRDVAFAWLSERARAGGLRLLAHDPVTAEEIAAVHARGVAVAEFPTTLEAARAARAHGMHIVAGAPNVLRGGSHSGNVSATDLIAAAAVDALSSDYLPSTPLAAALRLAVSGTPTHEAVRLVTAGPAAVAGLTDRGALAPGLRGDLVAVTVDGGWPTVRLVTTVTDGLASRAEHVPAGAA